MELIILVNKLSLDDIDCALHNNLFQACPASVIFLHTCRNDYWPWSGTL